MCRTDRILYRRHTHTRFQRATKGAYTFTHTQRSSGEPLPLRTRSGGSCLVRQRKVRQRKVHALTVRQRKVHFSCFAPCGIEVRTVTAFSPTDSCEFAAESELLEGMVARVYIPRRRLRRRGPALSWSQKPLHPLVTTASLGTTASLETTASLNNEEHY